jgi:serine/threonine protein kinase
MSARTDSAVPPNEQPHGWTPPTADLDMTTDLNEENPSGLESAAIETTVDTQPSSVDAGFAAPKAAHTPVVPSEAGSAPNAGPPDPETLAVPTETEAECATDLSPGVVLNDRYLLEQVIGCGGVSIVYRARDMSFSVGSARAAQVALKTPRPELHNHERARARLTHEYQHSCGLSHPNIVRVLDLHVDTAPCFMTMELLDGKLLSAMMREWKTVPAAFAYRILQACARALAHAHGRSIVHGDFKPGNVFITRDETVKVIDFGAAAAPLTQESRIHAGTPAYASPEVLSGEAPELRDDVFSFACVAYELLTGNHPFDRRSSLQARDEGYAPPRAWNLSASQWLTLLSALSWRREQRPGDIEALLIALMPEARSGAATGARNERTGAREIAALRALPEDLMPRQRSWGFFVFIACAFAVTFIAAQRQTEDEDQLAEEIVESQTPLEMSTPAPQMPQILSAPSGLMGAPVESPGSTDPLASGALEAPDAAASAGAAVASSSAGSAPTPAAASNKGSGARLSEVSFEAGDVVTSEGSVAAVFVIRRSQPLSGRTRVQWQATSGTAEAGVDFAGAGGSVEFADGQSQRAIYVPLRNDLLKEEDENFSVRLKSGRGARLGKVNTVEATIKDDD